ncbi:MAG: hypothetical protein Q9195_002060 [Heterodermia aff. obscurata]
MSSGLKDSIYLRNLQLSAVVERDAWGRAGKTQPVLMSLRLHRDTARAGNSDEVGDTFSYGQMCKDVATAIDRKTFDEFEEIIVGIAMLSNVWAGERLEYQVTLPKGLLRVEGGLCRDVVLQRYTTNEWRFRSRQWTVRKIKAACIIGVNPHERLVKQAVSIDICVPDTVEDHDGGTPVIPGLSIGVPTITVVRQLVDSIFEVSDCSLDQLKATGTTVVCDSGDFATIDKYKAQDATTNPSLILAASKKEEYAKLMDVAVEYGKEHGKDIDEKVDATLDRLLVEFGKEILKIVPGKVSTEVDARFSFDVQGSINKALHIIELYKSIGIKKERILIKLASTWEGIKAAHTLQTEHGINCNLTLMFSLPQAIAAAEAGAFLISPFVGRILDWYKAAHKKDFSPQEDPGVKSVQAIFNYYKKYGYKTIVMGASFRNVGEITELAGCDYLTISPNLLEDLYNSKDKVPQKLIAEDASSLDIPKRSYINDESLFRFDFNEEAMAVEKLREGISKFAADAITLKEILQKKIESA